MVQGVGTTIMACGYLGLSLRARELAACCTALVNICNMAYARAALHSHHSLVVVLHAKRKADTSFMAALSGLAQC